MEGEGGETWSGWGGNGMKQETGIWGIRGSYLMMTDEVKLGWLDCV